MGGPCSRSCARTPDLSDIPIIVISMLDDDQSATALGASAYMTKPVDRDRLVGNIQAIFGEATDGKKALVVDDDAEARDIASRLLTAQGFEVATAENGAIAFSRMSEGFRSCDFGSIHACYGRI